MAEFSVMNPAQTALLHRLRELIEETPESGALNAAGQPLYVNRFERAVEARAEDGPALVEYARAKVHEKATSSYNALIKAKRPDLTVEAVVANTDAPWASEFTEADRTAARDRLGAMIAAHRKEEEAAEAEAVERDREVARQVNERRAAKGHPPLSPEQEADVLRRLAERRAFDNQ